MCVVGLTGSSNFNKHSIIEMLPHYLVYKFSAHNIFLEVYFIQRLAYFCREGKKKTNEILGRQNFISGHLLFYRREKFFFMIYCCSSIEILDYNRQMKTAYI